MLETESYSATVPKRLSMIDESRGDHCILGQTIDTLSLLSDALVSAKIIWHLTNTLFRINKQHIFVTVMKCALDEWMRHLLN